MRSAEEGNNGQVKSAPVGSAKGFINLRANTGKAGEILEETKAMLTNIAPSLQQRGLRLTVALMDNSPLPVTVLDKQVQLTLKYETLVFLLSTEKATYAALIMLEDHEDMVSAAVLNDIREKKFIRTEAFDTAVLKGIEAKLGIKHIIPILGAFGNTNSLNSHKLAEKIEVVLNGLLRAAGEDYAPMVKTLRHLTFNASGDKETDAGKIIPTHWEARIKTDAGAVQTSSMNLGSVNEEFIASGTIGFGIYTKPLLGAAGRTEQVPVLVPQIIMNHVSSTSDGYPGVAETLVAIKGMNVFTAGDDWMYPLLNSANVNIGLLSLLMGQKPIKLNDNSMKLETKLATIKKLVPEQPKLFLSIEYLSFDAVAMADFSNLMYTDNGGAVIADKLASARAGVVIAKALSNLTGDKYPVNSNTNKMIVSKIFLPDGYYKDNNSGKMIPLSTVDTLTILKDPKNGVELAIKYSNIMAGQASSQSYTNMLDVYSRLYGAENVFITGERILVELSNGFVSSIDSAFQQHGMTVNYAPHINISQHFTQGAMLDNNSQRIANFGTYGQSTAGYQPSNMAYYKQ